MTTTPRRSCPPYPSPTPRSCGNGCPGTPPPTSPNAKRRKQQQRKLSSLFEGPGLQTPDPSNPDKPHFGRVKAAAIVPGGSPSEVGGFFVRGAASGVADSCTSSGVPRQRQAGDFSCQNWQQSQPPHPHPPDPRLPTTRQAHRLPTCSALFALYPPTALDRQAGGIAITPLQSPPAPQPQPPTSPPPKGVVVGASARAPTTKTPTCTPVLEG